MAEVIPDHEEELGAQIRTPRNQVQNLALEQFKLKVATFAVMVVSFLVLVIALVVFLAK